VSNNRRSFVSVLNLVDLIQVCLDHPAAANCTFLISDGEDISTTDLIKRLCSALNIHPILLPIPPFFLLNFARLLGKNDLAQRLLGDLRIDIQYTCDTLKWYPAHSLDQGLKITANAFHKTHTS
jgi:nucleoside-diphosphate-sugar epimerase